MTRITHLFISTWLAIITSNALAITPKKMITHNMTDVQSNAFVADVIPSTHPTAAHNDGSVDWISVRMACTGYTVNFKCSALIKMSTDTNNPIDLGTLTVDLRTGEITPTQLKNNGYTLTVNGPGETTITAD